MSTTCDQPAVNRMCWPNHDPMPICEDHKAWAVQIAKIMGFDLPMIDVDEGVTCVQKATATFRATQETP